MLLKATKIYAANVRGLVKNLKIINSLQLETNDVLLFSEIWNIKDFEHINIQGFELIEKYQRQTRGGGVAIFIKTGQKAKKLNGIINEGITESVGIQLNGLNIYCVYRPPSGSKQLFIEDLCQLLDNNNGRRVIIGGDFNIDNFTSNNILNTWANLYRGNMLNTVFRQVRNRTWKYIEGV